MNIKWIDDESAVAIADSLGIEHSAETICVDDIDRKKSAQNRAREIPLDEGRLEGIRHSASIGIPIPKIFVVENKSKFIIAGGNHRFNALEKELLSIPVHCAACTDAEFEVLCRALNTVVGVGMTVKERMSAAADAVERLGMTRKSAAKIYGVSASSVENEVKNHAVQRRISELAPTGTKRMTKAHIVKLGKLVNNDNVLKAAVIFVQKSKADSNAIGDLAAIAREETTESKQVAIFEEATKPYLRGKISIVPKKMRKAFLLGIKQLETIEGKSTWQAIEMERSEVSSARERIAKVVSTLNCLYKANG